MCPFCDVTAHDLYTLRSADTRMLLVSRMWINFGDWAFSAAGPRVWNDLSTDLWQPGLSYNCLRKSLKTFLFSVSRTTTQCEPPFNCALEILLLTYLLACLLTYFAKSHMLNKKTWHTMNGQPKVGSIWNTCISNTYLKYFLYLVFGIWNTANWVFGILEILFVSRCICSNTPFKTLFTNTFNILSTCYFKQPCWSLRVFTIAVVLVQWAEYVTLRDVIFDTFLAFSKFNYFNLVIKILVICSS